MIVHGWCYWQGYDCPWLVLLTRLWLFIVDVTDLHMTVHGWCLIPDLHMIVHGWCYWPTYDCSCWCYWPEYDVDCSHNCVLTPHPRSSAPLRHPPFDANGHCQPTNTNILQSNDSQGLRDKHPSVTWLSRLTGQISFSHMTLQAHETNKDSSSHSSNTSPTLAQIINF